jgi:hypothetical protein
MKIKNYKNQINEIDFGIIIEGINAGQNSYIENPEIKEVFIDGQWIPNLGYDLQKVKSQKLSEIESKILDASMKLDKANLLNLQTQVSELTAKLTELNNQKGEINAL